jgi:lysophospholipase L1-like esterase
MTEPEALLFVGNSFVARNDVPGLVAALGRTADARVRPVAIVAGGASLRRHHNGGRIAAAIAAEPWRQVVLQEQSTLPLKNRARYHDNVRAVRDEIVAASAATGRAAPPVVLYGTWARRAERGRQADLDEAVATIAAEIGARVAPAGAAWTRVLAAHPTLELYDRDGSHPTPAGSFLAACAIALTLFDERAQRITPPPVPKVDAATAALLLDAARAATPSTA